MDYEKNKEALVIVKHMVTDGQISQEVAEKYFPELAESEDEKIRKEIIDFVKSRGGFKGDWIAWLEKQGEQNTSEWRQDNVEELTEFENVMMHIGSSFFGENAGLNPNDTTCIKEQANLLLELVPKQEWSEEDIKTIERIVYILDGIRYYNTVDNKQEKPCQSEIDWLKSLRPQSQWKPSDEQIKALNYVINLMASSESLKENDYYYNVFKGLREQLKKL